MNVLCNDKEIKLPLISYFLLVIPFCYSIDDSNGMFASYFIYLFNFFLDAPHPTLGHCQRESLTHPMLITAFLQCRPEGHQEPRNKVGSLSPVECLVEFEPEPFSSYGNALTH